MRCVFVWFVTAWVESGAEWMRGLGMGFINPGRTGGALDVCLCLGFGGVGGVGGRGLGPGYGGVGCLCEF